MSLLFQPLAMRGLSLPNRVVVAPMCQYSAIEGAAQDWHLQHYGSLVASGPGMVVIEATAVSPEGRITSGDLGLYSDQGEEAFSRLVRAIKTFGESRIAVQLGHAGRKGSSSCPWQGGGPLTKEAGAWQTLSASGLPFGKGWPEPGEIDLIEMDRLRLAFSQAAQRALRAGVDAVEIHVAHGYLLHQFLSPLSNHRDDAFGGSLVNRMRFPLDVVRAVRRVLPTDMPLGIRISATDWVEGGFSLDEAVVFSAKSRLEGVDYVCVSSGGLVPDARIPSAPGYQVPLAARIHGDTSLLTRAVGLITDPLKAEEILAREQADMVALGRAFLDDPRWVWRAAAVLGGDFPLPRQYLRAKPNLWPGARMRTPPSLSA